MNFIVLIHFVVVIVGVKSHIFTTVSTVTTSKKQRKDLSVYPSKFQTPYPRSENSFQNSIVSVEDFNLFAEENSTFSPSEQPSLRPSLLPTIVPTTFVPTVTPSEVPSFQPTSTPSAQPTNYPTIEPSSQPVLRPSSIPSGQPIGSPTVRPSSQPSDHPSCSPSGQPTSQPSEIPDCAAGTKYVFTDDGDRYECIPCPAGQFSQAKSDACYDCEVGYYSIGSWCIPCPANTYSSKPSNSCIKCAPGLANSGIGNTSVKSCVNPSMNFAFAFVSLFICTCGMVIYIIGGRLHRLSFLGKARLVSKTDEMYSLVYEQMLIIGEICRKISHIKRDNLGDQPQTTLDIIIKLLFILLLGVLLLVIVIAYFFASVLRVFFTALILYRGYNLDISFISRIEVFLDNLLLDLQMPFLRVLFYPFVFAFDVLASFNISFASVNVTCVGSQIPIQLLVNCLVVGVVVLVIQSDMEVFWSTAFYRVHHEFRSLLLQRQFWKCDDFLQNLKFIFWSIALQLMPHPRKILQYGLSVVQVFVFFREHGHGQSSSNCDSATSFPVDDLLAQLSSCLAYLVMFPIIFMFSQILVPAFRVDFGTIKAPEKSRRYMARHDVSKCEKCQRTLMRHYTDQFDAFHCSHSAHVITKHQRNAANLGKTFQVVYGCAQINTCKWAICRKCYQKTQVEKVGNEQATASLPFTDDGLEPNQPLSDLVWFQRQFGLQKAEEKTDNVGKFMNNVVKNIVTTNCTDDDEDYVEEVKAKENDGKSDNKMATVSVISPIHVEKHECNAKPLAESTHWWSNLTKRTAASTKLIVSSVSPDWFYVKITFLFANNMFSNLEKRQQTLRQHALIQTLPEVERTMSRDVTKPKLYWITSLCFSSQQQSDDAKLAEELESKAIEEKWRQVSAIFPTYYRMVLTVQEDLMPKTIHDKSHCSRCQITPIVGVRFECTECKTFSLCEQCELAVHYDEKCVHLMKPAPKATYKDWLVKIAVVIFSWTIFGQLCSERGRKIWWRVVRNYIVFLRITFGRWTEHDVKDFELLQRFDEADVEEQLRNKQLKDATRHELECYRRRNRMALQAALVSTRVVLIQLLPYLTLLSTLAADISASPIAVRDPKLLKRIPALVCSDSREHATQFLMATDNDDEWWKQFLLGVYIYVEESRFIQFLLNIISNTLALALVFSSGHDSLIVIVSISFVYFIVTAMISAIYPFIQLHKMLFPVNNSKRKQKDDEVIEEVTNTLRSQSFDSMESGQSSLSGRQSNRSSGGSKSKTKSSTRTHKKNSVEWLASTNL